MATVVFMYYSLGEHVPDGYVLHAIQGFLEELIVNDDPEYQVGYHMAIT